MSPPVALPENFSADLYLKANPDVAAAGLDPAEHYRLFGHQEGRRLEPEAELELPAEFSEDAYLRANPDIAGSGLTARDHYLHFGRFEGRPLHPSAARKLFPSELAAICERSAAPFNVCPIVHSADHLFDFFSGAFSSEEKAAEVYFSDGADSARLFAGLIAQYPGSNKVLEFASGYGRVTRHMKHAAPHIELTACDIHPEANAFVRETVGVTAIESTPVPEDFKPAQSYDLAFALSLFSHLPASSWTRWLRALVNAVRPGGIVAFTTHGRVTARNQSLEIPTDDLLFRAISEQADLELATYGTSYVTPKYAFRQINSLGNARIVDFSEGHWWAHQDLYVIQRI